MSLCECLNCFHCPSNCSFVSPWKHAGKGTGKELLFAPWNTMLSSCLIMAAEYFMLINKNHPLGQNVCFSIESSWSLTKMYLNTTCLSRFLWITARSQLFCIMELECHKFSKDDEEPGQILVAHRDIKTSGEELTWTIKVHKIPDSNSDTLWHPNTPCNLQKYFVLNSQSE